jgi:hypothetical protein
MWWADIARQRQKSRHSTVDTAQQTHEGRVDGKSGWVSELEVDWNMTEETRETDEYASDKETRPNTSRHSTQAHNSMVITNDGESGRRRGDDTVGTK